MAHPRKVFAGILAVAAASPALAAPAPQPASFAMCAVCHKTGAAEKSMLGPNLFGVGGRKAGATAFNYSPAMKAAKLNWTKNNLIKFVADPRGTVPGNRMAFAGIKDPKKAEEVANYLMSLK